MQIYSYCLICFSRTIFVTRAMGFKSEKYLKVGLHTLMSWIRNPFLGLGVLSWKSMHLFNEGSYILRISAAFGTGKLRKLTEGRKRRAKQNFSTTTWPKPLPFLQCSELPDLYSYCSPCQRLQRVSFLLAPSHYPVIFTVVTASPEQYQGEPI